MRLFAAVVALIAIVVGCGRSGSSSTKLAAGEILLEANSAAGPDPFTGSLVPAGAPTSMPPATTPVVPVTVTNTAAGAVPLASVRGDQVGLYGGTLELSVCDQEQLISFLERNPGPANAFASVEAISVNQIRSYVNGLSPVVLGNDTRVTNHGYANGRATPRQAVLQAGTAVLIDAYGMPRVRCYCGNPLLPPVPASVTPTYVGPRWPTFNPTTVVVVQPTPAPITNVIVVDILRGGTVTVTIGGGATTGPSATSVVPATSSRTPSSAPLPTATSATVTPTLPTVLPTVTVPQTRPPVLPTVTVPPVVTQPPVTAAGQYQLAAVSVTRTYGGNIGVDPVGVNAVSPGTVQAATGTRQFPLGWDYLWPETRENRNRTMASVTLTNVPQQVTAGVPAGIGASMSGEWITTGYGVDREHLLQLGGAVPTKSIDVPGAPSSSVSGSISTAGSAIPTISSDGSQAYLTVAATVRFGGDHTGDMEITLIFDRVA